MICPGLLETYNALSPVGLLKLQHFCQQRKVLRWIQPCENKYFQKSALRYQLWPPFSRLIFNENASFLEFEFKLMVIIF